MGISSEPLMANLFLPYDACIPIYGKKLEKDNILQNKTVQLHL